LDSPLPTTYNIAGSSMSSLFHDFEERRETTARSSL
jgi:hypothetical protein